LIEFVKNLYRLAAQFAIDRTPLFLGELAGSVIHLKVTDLAVLGVTRGLKVGNSPLVMQVILLGNLGAQRLANEPDAQSENDDCD
jgi:hypothetical protein